MQLPSGQRDKHQGLNLPIPAVRATPPAVMVFASPENSVIKMIFHGRQARWQKRMPPRHCGNMHIPPNVMCHNKKIPYHKLNHDYIMKTYKKNAVIIGALFIFTMLAGMIDAYFVAPELKNPIISILQIDSKILLGVFSVLIMAIGIVFIAIAFFPVIKEHSESIALTYLILRAVECFLLIVGSICYLYIIALGKEYINKTDISNYLIAFSLAVKIKYYSYLIAMIVLGIGSLFLSYSLYKSRLVPRFISIWGGLGYILLLLSAVFDICGLIDTTSGLGVILYVPGGLWEMIVFPLWLFIKGFNITLKD